MFFTNVNAGNHITYQKRLVISLKHSAKKRKVHRWYQIFLNGDGSLKDEKIYDRLHIF